MPDDPARKAALSPGSEPEKRPAPSPVEGASLYDELTYPRAAARIGHTILVIGAFGTAVAFLAGGWQSAAGFALGAALSSLSFRWLRKLVDALGGDSPPRKSSVVLAFRYLILGGGAYVILRLTSISLTAVLAGVFVLTAAVFVEVIFEIVYARK